MRLPSGLIALMRDTRSPTPPTRTEPRPAPPQTPPPEPVPQPEEKPAFDPNVCLSFAMGWQMTEVYQCARRIHAGSDAPAGPPPEGNGLPCLRELDAIERARLAIDEMDVALFKLRGRFAAADLEAPKLTSLTLALATSGKDDAALLDAVGSKHDELLRRLVAADYRLGKAYRMGVELAETTVRPESHEKLDAAFGSRAVSIRTALADLASALPPHSSRSVSISLRTWERWASDPELDGKPVCDSNWAAVRMSLRRQGELWRSLLSGEKCGEDMLSMTDYVRAANGLVAKAGRTVLQFTRRWVIGLVFVGLLALAGAVAALIAPSDASKVGTAVAALAAAVGITGAGLRARASHIVKQLETRLWSAEMDGAIARAVTIGPSGWGVQVSDVTLSAAGDGGRAARQIQTIQAFRYALTAGRRRRLDQLLAPRVRIDLGDGRPGTDRKEVLSWASGLSSDQRRAFTPRKETIVAGYPGYFVMDGPDGSADLWRVREGRVSCWRRFESADEARVAAGLAMQA